MTNQKISTKKLKAIVFTDIVDFTKISAEDEQRALDIINKQREILKPIVFEHKGEWLKEIGDGLLFSFDSSLDAVQCSIQIQQVLQKVDDFKIRIGIHQGDIFIKDGDVYGDDVNITSRVEAFAPEGGIAISDKVSKDIAGVKDIKTLFIGFKKLKGVTQETKIYCITSNNLPAFKKQWLPYLTGLLLISFGVITMLATTVLQLSYRIFNMDYLGVDFLGEYDWGHYFKAMIRHFSIFIFGYSNLMYVNGVSSKTHKYFVYSSYLVIMFFIFAVLLSTPPN